MDSNFNQVFDMFDVSRKLNHLFDHADAVLQRAGFFKTIDERLDMLGNFVDRYPMYRDAEIALCNFVEQLDISNVSIARNATLDFLHIQNDGSSIFQIPNTLRCP
jgi:hypothetical protein